MRSPALFSCLPLARPLLALARPLLVALIAIHFSAVAWSQRPNPRAVRQMQQRIQQQLKEAAENQPELAADPQVLALQKEFIAKTEKLASEFERKKQFAQAREAYESLVRLIPKYQPAEAGLKRVLNSQSLQDKKITDVKATGEWQDSGAVLREGMPVHIEVKGSWKVVYETGPKGIEIPQEKRINDGRIKLGSLIGVVVNSPSELKEARPFLVEDGDDFIAKKSGRLFLRMYDVDPTDNEGKLYVLIQSTFNSR